MADFARVKRRSLGLLSRFSLTFARWIDTPVPLLSKFHTHEYDQKAETLFVLLPGIQDQHTDFEVEGFIKVARELKVPIDLVAVDAHVGYYADKTILDRIYTDIVWPAKQGGYKKIWFVGASLGGLGSVLYAGQREADLAGVLLLAPFLGSRSLIRKIEKSGGPASWAPKQADFKSDLWRWLNLYFEDSKRNPSLFLGYGDRDPFSYANAFLAEALPSDRVIVTPGSHNWETWRKLWIEFLERYKSKL